MDDISGQWATFEIFVTMGETKEKPKKGEMMFPLRENHKTFRHFYNNAEFLMKEFCLSCLHPLFSVKKLG